MKTGNLERRACQEAVGYPGILAPRVSKGPLDCPVSLVPLVLMDLVGRKDNGGVWEALEPLVLLVSR